MQSDHLGERSYKGFVGTCSSDCHQSQVKVVCQSSAGSLRRENLLPDVIGCDLNSDCHL